MGTRIEARSEHCQGLRTYAAGPTPLIYLLVGALLLGAAGCNDTLPEAAASADPTAAAPPPAEAVYVGRAVCAGCHPGEDRCWQGSHHDRAMDEATEESVLGRFDGTTLTDFGIPSTFFRRDGRFLVRTEGADGQMRDFAVAYTFGVEPLQQYLVELPGGRLQALPVAWDSRPAAAGGQRWFHLSADEPVAPGDSLHWTGPAFNANSMCAECHTTGFVKGYREAEDRFETTWAETDVACEACHGPGSRHVAWARRQGDEAKSEIQEPLGKVGGTPVSGDRDQEGGTWADDEQEGGTRGFAVRLRAADRGLWVPDPATGRPRRLAPAAARGELEVCARCHSRRSPLGDGGDGFDAGRPLLDTHLPALLDEELYFPDGQIRGEVFEVGSFLQSEMHHQGVTCSDCHKPHGLTLRAAGNDLCTRCHAAARFDTSAHHFHAAGSAGASCVECHMPARTYMEVDPRRDHSLRVPRPDLTLRLGTPNACNGCHQDRSPAWAAAEVESRTGRQRSREPHWGEAVAAARRGLAGAGEALLAVAADLRQPAVVRATALAELRRDPAAASSPEVAAAAGDPDPLVRLGAARGLAAAPPEIRVRRAASLLRDPLRAVRLEAAQGLAGLPPELLTAHGTETLGDLTAALAELEAAQRANAEQPEAQLALGWLALLSGDLLRAETAYRRALDLDPGFTAAAVNLAEIYRRQGREEKGEPLLRSSLERDPASAGAHHALGLLLVRRGRLGEALEPLGRAAELAPGEPRYTTVFQAALDALAAP